MFARSGVDISRYSRHPDEAEVLFRPGTRFKVLLGGKAEPPQGAAKEGASPFAVMEEAGVEPATGHQDAGRFVVGLIDAVVDLPFRRRNGAERLSDV